MTFIWMIKIVLLQVLFGKRTEHFPWMRQDRKTTKNCNSRSLFMAEGHRVGLSISQILFIFFPSKKGNKQKEHMENHTDLS